MYAGVDNPNDAGFIPVNPLAISTYDLLTADGYYTGTTFKWNVQYQMWL